MFADNLGLQNAINLAGDETIGTAECAVLPLAENAASDNLVGRQIIALG